jgi:UDP-glucose 4-epimerase
MSNTSKEQVFVTGGAGFIGSNLTAYLLEQGYQVTIYDNLVLGQLKFIEPFLGDTCRFIEADLRDLERIKKEIAGHDLVFHLAANSDISYGATHTDVDLQNGTLATYNLLEAMRLNDIKRMVFASTSAIYGVADILPTPENYGPLHPISLYGASKLACEGLVSAFAHNFEMQAWIYRFANIIGHNGTHGALVDFIRKLRQTPDRLPILGDGRQAKPYIHVTDCISAMYYGFRHAREEVNCFNLAVAGATSVTKIAEIVIEEMGLENVKFEYSGGAQGWRGDVPQVELDPGKLRTLGWEARYTTDEAVRQAAKELQQQL